MYIGFSFSGVVKGILKGTIELSEIKKIYAGTALSRDILSDWAKETITSYEYGRLDNEEAKVYTEKATKIAEEIFDSGKLVQPRLIGYGNNIYNPFPNVVDEKELPAMYNDIKEHLFDKERFKWADDLLKEYL